jgi:hypothetical protein
MREIKYSDRFKRGYKRKKSGRHGKKLDTLPMDAVNALATDNVAATTKFRPSAIWRMERSPRLPH